jgi:hypothetical protein
MDSLTWTANNPAALEFLTPPKKLFIHASNGECLVEISLEDGTVKINHPGSEPEAANVFWKALHVGFPYKPV